MDVATPWHEVYPKLARLLYNFYLEVEDPGPALFRLFQDDEGYLRDNQWFDKAGYESLDPIQVFASLNSNKIRPGLRMARIQHCFRLLMLPSSEMYVPGEIDFSGCPAPVAVHILNFRPPAVQKEIWAFFADVMIRRQDALEEGLFHQVADWDGIREVSLTIFLFWIFPRHFLPLDKNTLGLLADNGRVAEKFIASYEVYRGLIPVQDTDLYILLAKLAVGSSLNLPDDQVPRKVKRYLSAGSGSEAITENTGFRLLAIKPLMDCNKNLLKVLEEERYYSFCDAYHIVGNSEVIYYESTEDHDLHALSESFPVYVSAIVGKNGAGKSTLVELLLAVINNIAWIKAKQGDLEDFNTEEEQLVPGIKVDLFFKMYTVFRLRLEHNAVTLWRYNQQDNQFLRPEEINFNRFPLDSLFYTILVNYSQYALNEKHTSRGWLKQLFHKNDAYQVPMVIDPFREAGNIDVNRQESLAKARLVANLLEFRGLDLQANEEALKITDYLYAKRLRLSLDQDKIKYVYNTEKIQKTLEEIEGYEDTLLLFLDIFDVPPNVLQHLGRGDVIDAALRYIFKKLLDIASTYSLYRVYLEADEELEELSLRDVNTYFKLLLDETSHITFKLRQAVNYLKYHHLPREQSFEVDMEELSLEINRTRKLDEDLRIIDLIPPPFFQTDIRLMPAAEHITDERSVFFSDLSSGEKQQLYSIHALLYHLRNIDSGRGSEYERIKYRFVHIMLEEIELYFHPELQRTYLQRLLESIERIELESIRSINLLFVTHSPFILSDIPSGSVLFLNLDKELKKGLPLKDKPASFGANIHELLAEGFFMEDSIGAFARKKISAIVEFYNRVVKADPETEPEVIPALLKEYNKARETFLFIKKNIGEDYIRGIIGNHLSEIERRLQLNRYLDEQIAMLRQEINQLEKRKNA
ncbi:MAG: hypothetical protein DI539_22825 [Flavobacterium psychrophilum]|nr:MAG: hypothetical protein DI539_22825 [Flavobacterium psychrophilum]